MKLNFWEDRFMKYEVGGMKYEEVEYRASHSYFSLKLPDRLSQYRKFRNWNSSYFLLLTSYFVYLYAYNSHIHTSGCFTCAHIRYLKTHPLKLNR